ncbi:MAG: CBS domain-containing protein [archaeon]
MRRISVGDVMTRNFVSLGPTSSLHDCAKKMARERVDSLLITKKKRLLGILTARDILWAITKKPGLDMKKVRGIDISTRKLAVITPSAEIGNAMEKMRASNFRRLPVISNDELIGVVTLKDILAVEPHLYAEMRSLMDVREEESKLEKADTSYPIEGLCENCGALSELLRVEGNLLCLDCREELY